MNRQCLSFLRTAGLGEVCTRNQKTRPILNEWCFGGVLGRIRPDRKMLRHGKRVGALASTLLTHLMF